MDTVVHSMHDKPPQIQSSPVDGAAAEGPPPWPPKHKLFGIGVTATTYDEAVHVLIERAKRRESAIVEFMSVHGVVEGSRFPDLGEKLNSFDMACTDGQPLRWALNYFYKAGLPDRVTGPLTTPRLCEKAAQEGVSIYLYGGSPEVVEILAKNLRERFPKLIIAGSESPPFRKLTPEEDEEVVQRINNSGAGLVFIGLGFPKQELFAYDHRHRIKAIQLCVGAAFDFHAGKIKMAPRWMQKLALEWFYRLLQNPKRLWKRYLVTNSIFMWKIFLKATGLRKYD